VNWDVAPGWQAAVSMISTQGRDEDEFSQVRHGARWRFDFRRGRVVGGDSRAQLNLLATRNDDDLANSDSPYGAWLDASTRAGWFLHNYGVFYLRPDLNWGGQSMNNDARGGYYRISHQRMRWNWSASLDHLNPVSGLAMTAALHPAPMRYQLNSFLGIGGSATYRSATTDAWVANVFADQRNRFGITRYQLNLAGNDDDESAWEVELNQSFPPNVGRRLLGDGQLRRGRAPGPRAQPYPLAGAVRLAGPGRALFAGRLGARQLRNRRDAQDGYAANSA
jgi:hypothetical protein